MQQLTKEELKQYLTIASKIHGLVRVVDPPSCRCGGADKEACFDSDSVDGGRQSADHRDREYCQR